MRGCPMPQDDAPRPTDLINTAIESWRQLLNQRSVDSDLSIDVDVLVTAIRAGAGVDRITSILSEPARENRHPQDQ